MFNFVNRVIKTILNLFKSKKQQSEKCRKCSVVKRGGITPAIIYTENNINHDDCDTNCGMDHKFTFIIFRLILIVLVFYILYRYGIIAIEGIRHYFS